MLAQLPNDFNALVTGASGGIGSALVDALLASSRLGRLYAVSRHEVRRDDSRLSAFPLDLTKPEGLEALGHALPDRPLHLVINTLGLLHDEASGIFPEKKLGDLDGDAMARLFHVNATTPALLLQTLEPVLKGHHPVLIGSLSARVGSIGDNRLGGWYAYRASKAAHNMLMKTAAVELRRLNPHAVVICLHPGTTDTALSAPFQTRVPEGKLFSPAFVAERLLSVLGERRPEDSGGFLDWNDATIPW
ncbi:SDR family NAD(P)-dependent oxidoreductase [Halomonas organivorans]|uniref:NAD(P)-dependent dehydrogenase (Short-subunit alcohol dehydrogenase family) n=1 Tax=Halomonas organivorans TaxID=257772 RepID=A0A7W5BYL7_9GAMM|nr:SDR family NAD(P)-dependent oxidoreductase [Halomonas organivorans]MBB3141189.1 NAD(P)-dependent dehydrogenase (short-subunit alcohol dehydrogenase family) [Halomonas organivorans]